MESFLINHEHDLSKIKNIDIDSSNSEEENSLHSWKVDKLRNYFSQYSWVASVSIPKCDRSISVTRAEKTIELALNIFKLFWGEKHGYRLRQGNIFGDVIDTAKLTKNSDSIFDVSIYGKDSGDVFALENWFDLFTSNPGKFYLRGLIPALNACIDPAQNNNPDLIDRLIDGLFWFGQAVSEKNIAIKIIKYLAGIERLIIAKKSTNPTKNAEERIAILYHRSTKKDLSECHEIAKRIYSYRSKLMHGSISPDDEKLFYVNRETHDVATKITFLCINLFELLSLEYSEKVLSRQLEGEYIRLQEEYFPFNTLLP
jgi:Apea-like HEPN